MKKILLFITLFGFSYTYGQSVVVWSEDFQNSSAWDLNISTGGTNGPGANEWIINDNEGGIISPGCAVKLNGNNTLHVTNTNLIFPDANSGAVYYSGDNGASGGLADGTTDVRAGLTTGISTLGYENLELTFDWMGVGQANTDYAELEYSTDGGANWISLWTQAPGNVCNPGEGEWSSQTIPLNPAIFENQSDLRFALRWQNNNDMVGDNPSFAIDNIELNGVLSQVTANFTTPSLTICVDDCIDFTDASVGTNINDWTWTFNGADTPASSSQNPTDICYSTEGVYDVTLTITDDTGTDTRTVQITVVDCNANIPPTAVFSIDTTIVCAQDCISLTDLSTGNPTNWYWEFDGANPSYSTAQHPNTICFDSAGTFDITLTVTNDYGTDQIITSVTVLELPEIEAFGDTLIDMQGTAVLTAEPLEAGSFYWTPSGTLNCNTCLETNASPNQTTSYYASLVGLNGCTGRDTVIVVVNFVDVVDVASAFSPNDDGQNDVLNVLGVGILNIDFKIYNRYGQLVFETDDVDEGWDGTMEGRPASQGVYVWTLEYGLIDGSSNKKSGNVTLIK